MSLDSCNDVCQFHLSERTDSSAFDSMYSVSCLAGAVDNVADSRSL